jgi:ABC-type polysaccharide/polyol phosphate transport system ATPase subunit
MSIQAEGVDIAELRNEKFVVEGSRPAHQSSQTPSASALAASHLEKKYGKRRVVDDVGLHVEKGDVVGLLGENGAG